jgi:hypothetical protein
MLCRQVRRLSEPAEIAGDVARIGECARPAAGEALAGLMFDDKAAGRLREEAARDRPS